MKSAPTVSDAQSQAKQYLEKHCIEEILADMVNTITHIRMEDPILFMIKYLALIHTTEVERTKHGIHIENKQLINPVLFIPYPSFRNKQILQQTLDKDSFLQCKNRYTKLFGTLRKILKISMEYPDVKEPKDPKNPKEPKARIYMVDPECYVKFEPVITPILTKLVKNYQPNFQYQRPTQPINLNDIMIAFPSYEHIKPYIQECQLKLKRNYEETKFGNVMTPKERFELTSKMGEWLQRINFTVQDAADQAKQKRAKGLRYPDWPKNRSVATNKNLMVWLNKEDHIECRSVNLGLAESLHHVWEFADQFDHHSKAAFTAQHGIVDQYIRLTKRQGLQLRFKVRVENAQTTRFLQNIKPNPYFTIKKVRKESKKDTKKGRWIVTLASAVQLNRIDLVSELDKLMKQLFNDIVVFQVPQSSHVIINIEESKVVESMETEHETLESTIMQIDEDTIYYDKHPPFLVVRRNISDKSINLQTLMAEYCSEQASAKKEKGLAFLKQNRLTCEKFNSFHCSKDERYRLQQKDRLTVFTGTDDDLLIVFKEPKMSISQQLYGLAEELRRMEDFLDQKSLKFEYSPDTGFNTSLNKYAGHGISIMQLIDQQNWMVTMYSETMEAAQRDNVQVIELFQITPKSVKEFCGLVNDTLFRIKCEGVPINKKAGNQNHLSQEYYIKDLFETSKNLSCYTLYEEDLKLICKQLCNLLRDTLVQQIPPHLLINLNSDEALFWNPLRSTMLAKSDLNRVKKVRCYISRNFANYNFCQVLSQRHLSSLHDQLDCLLTGYEWYQAKIDESTPFKQAVTLYLKLKNYIKSECYYFKYKLRQIHINICSSNHIQVHLSCKVDELVPLLQWVGDLFNTLQKAISPFAKLPYFGYLGPIRNESLLSGVQFKFIVEDANPALCKRYGYQKVVTPAKQIDSEPEEDRQTEPLIDYDGPSYTLETSRPGHLMNELDFLKQLLAS